MTIRSEDKIHRTFVGSSFLFALFISITLFFFNKELHNIVSTYVDENVIFWTLLLGGPLFVIFPLGGWKYWRKYDGLFLIFYYLGEIYPSQLIGTTALFVINAIKYKYGCPTWVFTAVVLIASLTHLVSNSDNCPICNKPLSIKTGRDMSFGQLFDWCHVDCPWCKFKIRTNTWEEAQAHLKKLRAMKS